MDCPVNASHPNYDPDDDYTRRVSRGGGFRDDAERLRTTERKLNSTTSQRSYEGGRLARSVP